MSYVVPPDGGVDVGLGMVRKVVGSATHGGLGVAEALVPPGMFVPPHVHAHEDELTRVLEGALHVVVDDELSVAEAGAWILKPRGKIHAFWNAGPRAARVIELISPASLDDYFAELAAIVRDPVRTEDTRRAAIDAHHRRHGITFHEERVADYVARFGAPLPTP